MTSQSHPDAPTRFGVFTQPLHDPVQNPTATLERDLQLIEQLDALGYDEVWVGEHHSGGWELVGAPDIFLMAAAARTKNIRLGTGVTSVTYHHPLIVADRMCLLDHLTRGRIMFGVGPGALVSDAWMMGIDPLTQRARMQESLDAILELLSGKMVTRETEWFTLRDAHLQLMPYQQPCFEVAVAGAISPAGASLAGRYGISLLTINATHNQTFESLTNHWDVAETEAAHFGTTVDRRNWRMCGPMHIAETEEQARKNVAYGLEKWAWYFGNLASIQWTKPGGTLDELIDSLIDTGYGIIGTPDQAIAQINRIAESSGGFGSYLIIDDDWAHPDAKKRSYELFARDVMPVFRKNDQAPFRSQQFAVELAKTYNKRSIAAREKAKQDYDAMIADRAAAGASETDPSGATVGEARV